MIKVFKKSQIFFAALGLILITAGYLNYTYNPELKYQVEMTGNIDDSLGETIYVNAFNETKVIEEEPNYDDDTYFTELKIERNKMFDERIDTYKEILENSTLELQLKSDAQKNIEEITNLKNSIMIAENLILLKNVDNVAIITNGKNVNVIIKNDKELEKDEVAQIYSIINRELEVDINNVQIILKEDIYN